MKTYSVSIGGWLTETPQKHISECVDIAKAQGCYGNDIKTRLNIGGEWSVEVSGVPFSIATKVKQAFLQSFAFVQSGDPVGVGSSFPDMPGVPE